MGSVLKGLFITCFPMLALFLITRYALTTTIAGEEYTGESNVIMDMINYLNTIGQNNLWYQFIEIMNTYIKPYLNQLIEWNSAPWYQQIVNTLAVIGGTLITPLLMSMYILYDITITLYNSLALLIGGSLIG